MSFDLKDVDDFLQSISYLFDSGFGSSEIQKISSLVDSLGHDEENEIKFNVIYKEKQERLLIHVFMDDIDSPDIYFFSTSKELNNAISNEYNIMCSELGI